MVKDIWPGSESGGPGAFYGFGDRVIFVADGGLNNERAFWISDGTEEGTTEFWDPGENNGISTNWGYVFQDRLIFSMAVDFGDLRPYSTDGTPEGTYPLFTGNNHPEAMRNFHVFNDELYFSSWNGTVGDEVWKTDGTPEGSILLKNINSSDNSSSPKDFTEYNGHLYFGARTNTTRQLWRTDGTEEGTVQVSNINSDAITLGELTVFENHLFFVAENDDSGQELYWSDGTTEGTTLYLDLNPGDEEGEVGSLALWENRLYFRGDDGIIGNELRFLEEETLALNSIDLVPGDDSSFPSYFTPRNGYLFFTASDGEGTEPYMTDGTEEGTQLLADINPTESSMNQLFIHTINNQVVFAAEEMNENMQIWSTNGTAETTIQHTDAQNAGFVRIRDFIEFDNHLFFVSNDGNTGDDLWYS
ncbi:MAG: hypothetical protein AAF193_09970, partial [Bacteroidota bacterium]